MQKILFILLSLIVFTGCSNNKLDSKEAIYTYDGFYEGLDLNSKEQELVDNKMLHISEGYLAPTRAYVFDNYPFENEVENEYLKYNEQEINSFLEQKFSELVYGVVEIDIREDMMYDYQEFINEDGSLSGQLTYHYDIIGYEEAKGLSNKVNVDAELLGTLNKRDNFNPQLFSSAYEFGWYNELSTRLILIMYYDEQITQYYDELVNEINDYLDSTGRYYDKVRADTCPYLGFTSECAYVGDVNIGIGFSEHRRELLKKEGWTESFTKKDDNLVFNFAKNNMSVQEIISLVKSDPDFALGIKVTPYISYEIYNQGNLRGISQDLKATMRSFTDANLEWIVADKDQVKALINKHDITYNQVMYTIGIGFQLSSDETEYESFKGKSITYQVVRIYDGDYPWLTEDISRDNKFGHATEFKWKGNK